jgi:hypothetical protein
VLDFAVAANSGEISCAAATRKPEPPTAWQSQRSTFHKNPSFKVDSHAPTLFLLAFVARMVAQTGVLALI